MSVVLEVRSGPEAGQKVTLEPGKPVRIGRKPPADCVLSRDRMLSGLHFEALWDGHVCKVRDLESSNGTQVGGRRIKAASLNSGEEIRAGDSIFVLRVEAESTATVAFAEVIRSLAKSQPLYAILDAARTPKVLELLSGAEERFQTLYEGDSAVKLAACAPYLVRLPVRSRLLRKLVRHGWGDSWGVYLVSDAPFEAVRKHLRHFLMVKTEDGKDYYFRFYDPRVLPVFLKTADLAQQREFWGPIREFYADSADRITVPGAVAGVSLYA